MRASVPMYPFGATKAAGGVSNSKSVQPGGWALAHPVVNDAPLQPTPQIVLSGGLVQHTSGVIEKVAWHR